MVFMDKSIKNSNLRKEIEEETPQKIPAPIPPDEFRKMRLGGGRGGTGKIYEETVGN